jgi:predicted nucleic acid-binding protein
VARPPVRAFLDANVLLSAAYRVDSPRRALWSLQDTSVELVTSRYAVNEALTNLAHETQLDRLIDLLHPMTVITDTAAWSVLPDVELPEKDRPIMAAAMETGATHLITGDLTHFGALFGR